MTTPQEKAKAILKDWPEHIFTRRDIGPAIHDVMEWYKKHANALRELVENAAKAVLMDVDTEAKRICTELLDALKLVKQEQIESDTNDLENKTLGKNLPAPVNLSLKTRVACETAINNAEAAMKGEE